MSCVAKLYNRMLLNRIRDPIESVLRTNQNGFRPSRSTVELILAVRRIVDTISTKKDRSLCATFVDFSKAFDSISREKMFKILSLYGIPTKIVNAIRSLYDGSTSFVSTPEGDSDTFPVTTGVLQGDTLAPFLFIIVLDYALRIAMKDKELGIKIKPRYSSRYPAKYLTDLDFADDIVLLSESIKNAQSLLLKLEEAAKTVGLRINYKKTKAMTLNLIDPETLKLSDGNLIEFVADFCYLGSYICSSQQERSPSAQSSGLESGKKTHAYLDVRQASKRL